MTHDLQQANAIDEQLIKKLPLTLLMMLHDASISDKRQKLDELKAKADAIIISSNEAQGFASDIATEARSIERELEAKRREATAPLQDLMEKINGIFRPHVAFAQSIVRLCSEKVQYFRQEEQRRQQEQLRISIEERKENEQALPPVSAIVPNTAHGKASKAVGMKVLRWRVKDESKIPDVYWMLNTKLIDAAVKSGTEVPGIETYYEEKVVFRK
jgi:hypothetical protein